MTQQGNDMEWIVVGIVARAHGLRGALMVKSFTRTPEEFMEAPLETVYLRRKKEEAVPHRLLSRSIHKDAPMIVLEGISDRTAADSWKGAEILIPESERWELEEGQYYADDLVDLMLVEEGSGRELGRVMRVQDGAAHDYLVFRHPNDPKREVLLPFIPEFTPEVNFETNQIIVKLPDGLLDV
ncbi:16S rRNA processing protein RimM [Candidatus Sumerlaeota bacterium]|nr:16S rRNA processing protein RimM [Candidatus Sumerlaeota bacterium]